MKFAGLLFKCLMAIIVVVPNLALANDINTICDRRYAEAAEMVDSAYSRYGTLYSGGEHWRNLDNVGATIDLYRLWRGLPDHRFRDADDLSAQFDRDLWNTFDGSIHEALKSKLSFIHSESSNAPAIKDRHAVATLADLATTLGPSPGWWANPNATLSEAEAATRALVRADPFMEWVQMVLMASDAPWAYAWHQAKTGSQTDPMYGRLSGRALDQFENGQGLEWGIAAALLASRDDTAAHFGTHDMIKSCAASPAEYAAWSVMRLAALRLGDPLNAQDQALLPTSLYKIAYRNKAMVAARFAMDVDGTENSLDALVALAPDDAALSWLNVGRTYHAVSVGELVKLHRATPLNPKTLRALNVLSVSDLLQFSNAPDRTGSEKREIQKVAFARLIALRRWDEAKALIASLQKMHPKQSEQIADIMARNWSLEVRLALVALELPDLSVWLTSTSDRQHYDIDVALTQRIETKYGIDLPSEMRSGAFLQRDFETWLRMPNRWGAFRGMRGYSIAALTRAHDRKINRAPVQNLPVFLPEGPSTQALPFAKLIAWNEIAGLGPANGLSYQLSNVLIDWAKTGPRISLFRSRTAELAKSQSLRAIVRLGRRNRTFSVNGHPIGQVAFSVLHSRFPESEAAKLTPYWFTCTSRCEN